MNVEAQCSVYEFIFTNIFILLTKLEAIFIFVCEIVLRASLNPKT